MGAVFGIICIVLLVYVAIWHVCDAVKYLKRSESNDLSK